MPAPSSAELARHRALERFSCFAELTRCADYRENSDYAQYTIARDSGVAIVAPHGGYIERGTSEIAREIAGSLHSLYIFESLHAARSNDLHITSANFDAPRCLQIVEVASTVFTVHGYPAPEEMVLVGGRDVERRDCLIEALRARGINADVDRHFDGTHRRNICNRSREKKGVQLEISAGLRRLIPVSIEQLNMPLTLPVEVQQIIKATQEAAGK